MESLSCCSWADEQGRPRDGSLLATGFVPLTLGALFSPYAFTFGKTEAADGG